MTQPESDTVIRWIHQFRHGDEQAASDLWRRYFERVVEAAKRRLADMPRRVADEEDIGISVLRYLCDGAAQGRFDKLANHDDLWRLLLTITRQKCVDHVRHYTREKRGGGKVRGESVLGASDDATAAGFDILVSDEPNPQQMALVGDQFERLLAALPEQVPHEVVLRRLESWSVEEIASELDISVHSVRRKLRLVRSVWRNIGLD